MTTRMPRPRAPREMLQYLQLTKVKDVTAAFASTETRFRTAHVHRYESVFSAVEKLAASPSGAVLVMDAENAEAMGKTPSGIFTTRDLARILLRGRDELRATAVGDEMTPNVVTCGPDTSLDDAMKLLADNNINHLCVTEFIGDAIDQDARITHVLTANEMLAFLLDAMMASYPPSPKERD